MSTHDGKNANANMVGTYCSARDAKKTHLSRNPITQMSTAYTTKFKTSSAGDKFYIETDIL